MNEDEVIIIDVEIEEGEEDSTICTDEYGNEYSIHDV